MLVSRGGKHFQVRQECGGTRGMEIEQDGKERDLCTLVSISKNRKTSASDGIDLMFCYWILK